MHYAAVSYIGIFELLILFNNKSSWGANVPVRCEVLTRARGTKSSPTGVFLLVIHVRQKARKLKFCCFKRYLWSIAKLISDS